jgi:imidazolonepropionase
MRVTAITGCGELLTMEGPDALGAIRDGAVRMEGGRITAVGPRAEIERTLPAGADVVDARGALVTPGLVDAHTHLAFGGCRADEFAERCAGASYSEIAAAGGGIRRTVAMTQAATDAELYESARQRLRWMLACGTTALEAKSGYGGTTEHELRALRLYARLQAEGPQRVVPTYLGLHACPRDMTPTAYTARAIEETLPAVAPLAKFADAFLEPGYFAHEEVRAFGHAAKALGLKLRLHVDQLSLSHGAELAAELGAATADHLEHTGPEGIAALAAAGAQPVLLPASVFALGLSRYPDARGMLAAGLRVVLATDLNPGSSPSPSLPFVMTLACVQMRMTPAEAWRAVTVHAAESLGLEDVGRLAPGTRADLVLWDVGDHREVPYWVSAPLAREVWIGGSKVLR